MNERRGARNLARRRRVRSIPFVAAAVLSLTLTACSSRWEKPGLTAEQWERDKYTCELQGRQASAGSGASGIFAQEMDAVRFRDRCLVLQGYTRVK